MPGQPPGCAIQRFPDLRKRPLPCGAFRAFVDPSRGRHGFMDSGLEEPALTAETLRKPPIGVLGALRRHWIVAIVPVIVLVGVAAALGLQRTPRYTATASLSVGRIYINNPAGVSSVLEATKSLASVYSRSIRSTAVLQDTERRLGEGSLGASDQVTATPIPQSPLIRISAESSSARRAVALATAASGALAAYVGRQGRSDRGLGDPRRLSAGRAPLPGTRSAASAACTPLQRRSYADEQGRSRSGHRGRECRAAAP